MTTRALLRFVGDEQALTERAQIYKHADGDPGTLLARLRAIEREIGTACADRGPGYAAAQFVYLDKGERVTLPGVLLGHAVVDTASRSRLDETYRYRVVVDGDDSGNDGDGHWHVDVSERRGFDPDASFERTQWQFSGTLPEAVATFAE